MTLEELLNTHPLKGLVEHLESLALPDRNDYLANPKWGVVRALAQLRKFPNGGLLQFKFLIDEINKIAYGTKTVIQKQCDDFDRDEIYDECEASLNEKGAEEVRNAIEITKNGIFGNHINVFWLLAHSRHYEDLIAWDTFTHKQYFIKERPKILDDYSSDIIHPELAQFGYAPVDNEQGLMFDTCMHLNTLGVHNAQEHIAMGALKKLAMRKQFDYLKMYNDARDPWNGKPILDSFPERFFELDRVDGLSKDEKKLVSIMWRKFCIGMMKRCYEPGCNFKFVLHMAGNQHIGKSGLAELMGGPFYSRHSGKNLDMSNPDLFYLITSTWVLGMNEMVSARKSDVETIKDFESQTIDGPFRPKFYKEKWTVPRRFVIITTLNPDGNPLFRDQTGNVRKWVIPMGQDMYEKFAFDEIKAVLPQMMSEARERYFAGEDCELTEEEAKIHSSYIGQHETENPSLYIIEQFLRENNTLIHSQGFRLGELKEYASASKATEHELSSGLRAMGLDKTRFRINGNQAMVWFYKEDREDLKKFYFVPTGRPPGAPG